MRETPSPHHATAVELVNRYGWNSTSYQILNPGIRHFVSRHGDAITGYVDYRGTRVAAGVPICAPGRLLDAMDEFEGAAEQCGLRVTYFYAEERAREMARDSARYAVVHIGAQPAWNPAEWRAKFDARPSLRAQLSRARNKGVCVVEWDHTRAERSEGLQQCLAEWLATRRMAELHFLVEPDTLGMLEGRRLFVAERDGKPVGFLLASPVRLRRGWLIEQVIRGNGAPNGTAECLIDHAMSAMAVDGDTFATLGLAALARKEERVTNPWWLRFLFGWARAHGRRFYNFGGLENFKAKFQPQCWEPVYIISREEHFSLRTLVAVAGAFTGGHLSSALWATLKRAVRQEIRWMKRSKSP